MKLKSLAMLAACLLVITAGAALADSPHFLYANSSINANNGDLTVSFKEVGLGSTESSTNVTVSADATAVYVCVNGGGNRRST